MSFRLTDHAEEELVRRQIPREVLEEVLQSPEQAVPEHHGRKCYQSRKQIGGIMFLARAIVDDKVDPNVVVTLRGRRRVCPLQTP